MALGGVKIKMERRWFVAKIALAVGKCGFAKLLRQPEILNVMQNKNSV